MYRAKQNGRAATSYSTKRCSNGSPPKTRSKPLSDRQSNATSCISSVNPSSRPTRADPRVRSAPTLATSRRGACRSRPVHPHRRGDRAHHRDRRLGPRPGLPHSRRMGATLARQAPRYRGERLGPPTRRRWLPRHCHRDPGAHRPRPHSAHPRTHREHPHRRRRQCPNASPRVARPGINLAIDDFGTGYSSLTYLRAFPIDTVKIDKSFVRTVGTQRPDTAIVAAVLALARTSTSASSPKASRPSNNSRSSSNSAAPTSRDTSSPAPDQRTTSPSCSKPYRTDSPPTRCSTPATATAGGERG